MGDLTLENIADATAREVISRLADTYHLIHVSYDDCLSDEQIQALLAGNWEDIPDADWESDSRWASVKLILEDLLDKDARDFLGEYEALDTICYAIQDRDQSDSIGDMMRNNGQMLLRYRLDAEAERDPCFMSAEEINASARTLCEAAGLDFEENADALRELVASACYGGGLYVLWRGEIAPVVAAVDKVRHVKPTPEITVQWTDPELLVLDRLGGSGHTVSVRGTVRVTLDPDRLFLDAQRMKGSGYSWSDVVGDGHYRPDGGEAEFIYPPAPAVVPTPPMLELTRYGQPYTHQGDSPAELAGQLVRVRPYYSVPSGRSSLTPARSPYVFEARVIEEPFGADMVTVEFTWGTESPWVRRQAFYPRELHRTDCGCAACKGDGIGKLSGA